jgi:hypothetical protein
MLWSFEIVSNFGFRASDFLFLAPLRSFDFAQDRLSRGLVFPMSYLIQIFKHVWLDFDRAARRRSTGPRDSHAVTDFCGIRTHAAYL